MPTILLSRVALVASHTGLGPQAMMEFAMDAMTISRSTTASTPAMAAKAGPGDPLDADSPLDDVVITTSRALCRLALVAAETGARFQREAEPNDPMAWLLTPRRMFAGSTALEACLEREHFMRALLLHGLSLGLDADPDEIDVLLDDPIEVRVGGRRSRGRRTSQAMSRPRLYTASVLRSTSGTMLHAFHASVAVSVEEFQAKLEARFGPSAAGRAEVRVGFDPAAPIVLTLVPAAIAKALRKVERESATPEYANFAVTIEHRLEA